MNSSSLCSLDDDLSLLSLREFIDFSGLVSSVMAVMKMDTTGFAYNSKMRKIEFCYCKLFLYITKV